MRIVRLDGRSMQNKETAHRYIQEVLHIPSYYGYNLDALYDALSVYDKELSILLINKPDMLDQLGLYGDRLIKTFEDVKKVNKNLEFRVI